MFAKFKKASVNIIFPILIALFNIIIIFYPKEIIEGSKMGVNLWFNNVLPSLLPFLIGTNLLMSIGVINFVGTILEPIMYPLFGVSGIGGFSLICGMTSGYPMGAKITSDLREKNLISKNEAQKLIGFTNNSGPLFIIGSIGLSMFKNANVGYFVLICHYLGALLTGIIIRNIKPIKKPTTKNQNIFAKASNSMKIARLKDKRRMPQIFADAIKNSMDTILMVGGYIILFSVLAKTLEITNVITYIDIFFLKFTNLSLNENILKGFTFGIMEMTNGINILSALEVAPSSILSAIFIVSFGGFCIHLQAISFISKTDINIVLYIACKILHGIISTLIGFFLFPIFDFKITETVFSNYNKSFASKLLFSSYSFIFTILLTITLMIIAIIYLITKRKRRVKAF